MHLIDMRTVLLEQVAINAICAAMVGLLYWHNRARYAGLGSLLGLYALQSAGLLFNFFRGVLPVWASIWFGNILAMSGFLLLFRGISQFWGRPHRYRLNLAMLAAFAAVHTWFTFVSPDLRVRSINLNFWLAAFFVRCARELYSAAPAARRRLIRLPTAAMAGFAAVALLRTAAESLSADPGDFFLSGPADTWLFLLFQLLTVLLTFGFFLMVNRRLLADTLADYGGRVEAERALNGALNVAKLGTWSWDIKADRLSWSGEMYRIFGVDPKTFKGSLAEVMASVIHPDDRALLEAANRAVAEAGKPEPTEYRVLRPDGSVRWVLGEASELVKDAEGRPEKLLGYAQDITARKLAAEKLRESAARLQLALEAAGMGLWSWDVGGDKRHFDKKVCSLLGLDAGAFRGTAEEFFAVVHPEDRAALKTALRETLSSDALYHPEYRAVLPGGGVRWVAARGRLRRDGAGRPLVLDGLLWDITEKKASETAIQSAQKLDSLGALAGGIAHDFNNLLTGITGNLSLLGTRTAGDAEMAGILRDAETACRAAGGLARQLLTFSSGGEPVKRPLDLGRLARESADFSLRGSGVAADIDDEGGVHVLGDRDQIFQAVQNLVINASQAMHGAGRVGIKVRASAGADGRRYGAVSVADKGPGIPAGVRERLFEPYFSTKGKGRGLGLAVCRSIVVKHGGSITADTSEREGSVFTIFLPFTEERPEDTGRRAAAAPARPGGARVLVMDDEDVVSRALVRILKALGYEPEVTVNGEEALASWRRAAEQGRPFSAAIMDLTISGGMGGAEAVKKLKALDPAAKVIVSSGYSEDPVMADHAAYGFDASLSKPFRVEDVERVLRDAVGV
jgi:PAS domain S-box-containing protein